MALRGEAHRAAIRAVLDAFGADARHFVFPVDLRRGHDGLVTLVRSLYGSSFVAHLVVAARSDSRDRERSPTVGSTTRSER